MDKNIYLQPVENKIDLMKPPGKMSRYKKDFIISQLLKHINRIRRISHHKRFVLTS